MSRGLTTAQQTALEGNHVVIAGMVKLELDSGDLCAHTGLGTISWDGDDYIGVGNLGEIGIVEEGSDVRVYGVSFTLSGIPPAYVSIALSEHIQERPAYLYIIVYDTDDHTMIGEPISLGRYKLDVMLIEYGETATITVTAENVLAAWERPVVARYNNEDQISRYPDDKGFEFVAETTEKVILWGVS